MFNINEYIMYGKIGVCIEKGELVENTEKEIKANIQLKRWKE